MIFLRFWMDRMLKAGIFCNILPFVCKKSKISRYLAGWEPSLSGLFASNPGHFFHDSKSAVSANMHPLWSIWAKRPEYGRIVHSMKLAVVYFDD